MEEVSKLKFDKVVMASFDIESLFTNIPIDKTIDMICDSIFKENVKKSNFFQDPNSKNY